MIDLSNLTNIMQVQEPASECEIQESEETLAVVLPNAYKSLLRYANGLTVNEGLTIYGTDELAERNETLEVRVYAYGFIAIGDDGGANVLLMKQGLGEINVFIVDVGDMNPDNSVQIAHDFDQWVNAGLLTGTIHDEVDYPDECDIHLITSPNGGLRDLIMVKKVLCLNMTTAALLDGSRNVPFVIAERYPYGKAKKLIDSFGPLGDSLYLKPV